MPPARPNATFTTSEIEVGQRLAPPDLGDTRLFGGVTTTAQQRRVVHVHDNVRHGRPTGKKSSARFTNGWD